MECWKSIESIQRIWFPKIEILRKSEQLKVVDFFSLLDINDLNEISSKQAGVSITSVQTQQITFLPFFGHTQVSSLIHMLFSYVFHPFRIYYN